MDPLMYSVSLEVAGFRNVHVKRIAGKKYPPYQAIIGEVGDKTEQEEMEMQKQLGGVNYTEAYQRLRQERMKETHFWDWSDRTSVEINMPARLHSGPVIHKEKGDKSQKEVRKEAPTPTETIPSKLELDEVRRDTIQQAYENKGAKRERKKPSTSRAQIFTQSTKFSVRWRTRQHGRI